MVENKNVIDGIYGGNRVSVLVMDGVAVKSFAKGVYDYFVCKLEAGSVFPIENLGSFTVFLLNISEDAAVTASSGEFLATLNCSDILQVENETLAVSLDKGTATILVAGTQKSLKLEPSVKHLKSSEIKRVIKPWGHELWFSGENDSYAFKEIAIQKGTKTSLQYHLLKKETTVLVEGRALLHFKNNEAMDNDLVSSADISTLELNAVIYMDVDPNTLHRLESLEDVLLYEVSTPHLDDVIRVSDDTSRVHGRIESEHRK